MKWIFLTVLSSLCLLGCAQSSVAEWLRPHRWQHRLVLTFSPDWEHPQLQAQQALRQSHPDGWEDRALFFLHLTPTGGKDQMGAEVSAALAQAFYDRYEVSPDAFTAILIGKDGGEKLRSRSSMIDREQLFAVIDAMPMRRREMREDDPDQR
jgi:hypothetical protein